MVAFLLTIARLLLHALTHGGHRRRAWKPAAVAAGCAARPRPRGPAGLKNP
jgi:hypothetical protein